MSRLTRIFWIGTAIYAASFFLVAVGGSGSTPQDFGPVRGYLWAWWALVLPWVSTDLWSQGALPILMPFLVVSGWINLFFVGSIIALWRRQHRFFSMLRILVLLSLPACWVVFYFGIHPREGYVAWILGMLLVLFSPSAEEPAGPPSLFQP